MTIKQLIKIPGDTYAKRGNTFVRVYFDEAAQGDNGMRFRVIGSGTLTDEEFDADDWVVVTPAEVTA